jgi:hypothetical protein
VDLYKKEVTITAAETGIFFVAQTGKNFNRSIFTDMDNHWARNYVEALYRKGIVKGRSRGIFAPNEPLTRAEFLKIALKAIEAETESADEIEDTPFRDVALYSWYLPYVKKAKELELVKGYATGMFKPEQFINRAEAVKILISAFDFDLSRRQEGSREVTAEGNYNDVEGTAWYYPYINFAIQNRLMDGIRLRNNKEIDSFGPGRAITRGEMAKLAIKTMELNEEFNKK